MDEIITERSGNILRVELNRPTKRNAMTSRMYEALAGIFNEAAKDERIRVVLWHGAGESGRELGSGDRGELVSRGTNVMRGYWNAVAARS